MVGSSVWQTVSNREEQKKCASVRARIYVAVLSVVTPRLTFHRPDPYHLVFRPSCLGITPRSGRTPILSYYSHNLCTTLSPPAGARYLLGLGEKFCIERGRPRGTDKLYLQNMSRFARSIRIRDAMKDFEGESDYIPGLYIPSPWNPGRADVNIEFRLMIFADRFELLH